MCSLGAPSISSFPFSDRRELSSDSGHENKLQDDSRGLEDLEGSPGQLKDNDKSTELDLVSGVLNLLPSLPLDVQLEIFSNLFPKDLLNVARSTKAFRLMLMTKKATTVWKDSREKSSVPDCPPWLSEPAWAALLFEQNCEICGVKKLVKLDLMISKKFCRTCQRRNAAPQHQLGADEEGLQVVFDLLVPLEQRYIRDEEGQLVVPSVQRLFWRVDAQNMHDKLNDLQKRVDMGLPAAQVALNDFRAEHEERCAWITKSHPRLFAWRQKYFNQRRADISERRLRSRNQIKECLIALEHERQDLLFLDSEPAANKSYIISNQKWEFLKPNFVTEAIRARATRLENDSRVLFTEVEARYIAYKKSLPVCQWKSLLPFKLLVVLEPVFNHTTPEKPFKSSPQILDELFRTLPLLLAQINDERTARLMSLLPMTEQSNSNNVPSTLPCIERAVSVFRCSEGDYLYGSDEARAHHCGARCPAFKMAYPFTGYTEHCERRREILLNPQLEYAPIAATVVGKLAELVGLDQASATTSDLDRCIDAKNDGKSIRFACVGCTVRKERYDYQFYRYGYNWRGLAAHLDSADASHNPSFSFTELPLAQAEEIKRCEEDQSSNHLKWACALCIDHVNAPQTREMVEGHLVANNGCHEIKNPIQPDDLVVTDTSRDVLRCTKFVVPPSALLFIPTSQVTDDTRCCRCTRVQDRVHVWIPAAVQDHLRAKHDITYPQVGLDYEYIVINQDTVTE